MRIIGNLDYPGLKATVFKMDNRLSIKFETGLYEQTYKFRSGEQMDTLAEVEQFIDTAFIQRVSQLFQQMHELRNQRHRELLTHPESMDSFEEII